MNGCLAWYMTRASRSPALAACHESEFTCYDGFCIPHSRRCDNIYDCADFSDEQNCVFTGISFIFVLPHLRVFYLSNLTQKTYKILSYFIKFT